MDEEERNYCCLILLLSRVGLSKLRDFFIKEWDSSGSFGPWTDCSKNGVDLLTIFTKTLPYERAKVQSGDTTTWDLSLFVKVLLNSSPPFVHIPNIALVNGLQCLKETRNVLCHTASGRIKSAEFQQHYGNACSALLLVGASKDDFNKVDEDVQKPWNEVLSLVKECSSQDEVILQRIEYSTKELKQGQSDIQKELKGLKDVLQGIHNLPGPLKPSDVPNNGEAVNQGDGGKPSIPTQEKHSDERVESAGNAKETKDRKQEATFYAFDRSGSMTTMGNAPAEALFKETLDKVADALDGDFVCIQAFDDQIDPPLHSGPAKEIKLTFDQIRKGLSPQGRTALNDAIANVMLKAMTFRESNPGHEVAVVIYTDGEENSSVEYSGSNGLKKVNSLVRKARAMGVHVIFMAANIDVFKTGNTYGVPQASCLEAGQGNFVGLDFAAERIRSVSSGISDHVEFSTVQRVKSKDLCPGHMWKFW